MSSSAGAVGLVEVEEEGAEAVVEGAEVVVEEFEVVGRADTRASAAAGSF